LPLGISIIICDSLRSVGLWVSGCVSGLGL